MYLRDFVHDHCTWTGMIQGGSFRSPYATVGPACSDAPRSDSHPLWVPCSEPVRTVLTGSEDETWRFTP